MIDSIYKMCFVPLDADSIVAAVDRVDFLLRLSACAAVALLLV